MTERFSLFSLHVCIILFMILYEVQIYLYHTSYMHRLLNLPLDGIIIDLFCTCRKMHKNRPQLLVAGLVILHDNARPHIVDVVAKNLRDYGWEVLPHAPYNPDMSPPD